MNLTDRLFDEFLDANKLGFKPAFGRRPIYQNLSGLSGTREELMRSEEFAGFCDGYQKKDPRYSKEQIDIFTGVVERDSNLKRSFLVNDSLGKLKTQLREAMALSPQGRYVSQYSIGRRASG